jgi:hypothetical protein
MTVIVVIIELGDPRHTPPEFQGSAPGPQGSEEPNEHDDIDNGDREEDEVVGPSTG